MAPPPTFAPSIYNDPGRLDVNFTKSSGMIAAAAIFSSIFVIGMWAIFYVYWYMVRFFSLCVCFFSNCRIILSHFAFFST
jgi:hypothetical protein